MPVVPCQYCRLTEKERRIRDLEWKIEDVRKACEVEIRSKDQILEAKNREVQTLKARVKETSVTQAHTELIQKSAAVRFRLGCDGSTNTKHHDSLLKSRKHTA